MRSKKEIEERLKKERKEYAEARKNDVYWLLNYKLGCVEILEWVLKLKKV